jgi:hypothetical protein
MPPDACEARSSQLLAAFMRRNLQQQHVPAALVAPTTALLAPQPQQRPTEQPSAPASPLSPWVRSRASSPGAQALLALGAPRLGGRSASGSSRAPSAGGSGPDDMDDISSGMLGRAIDRYRETERQRQRQRQREGVCIRLCAYDFVRTTLCVCACVCLCVCACVCVYGDPLCVRARRACS